MRLQILHCMGNSALFQRIKYNIYTMERCHFNAPVFTANVSEPSPLVIRARFPCVECHGISLRVYQLLRDFHSHLSDVDLASYQVKRKGSFQSCSNPVLRGISVGTAGWGYLFLRKFERKSITIESLNSNCAFKLCYA